MLVDMLKSILYYFFKRIIHSIHIVCYTTTVANSVVARGGKGFDFQKKNLFLLPKPLTYRFNCFSKIFLFII